MGVARFPDLDAGEEAGGAFTRPSKPPTRNQADSGGFRSFLQREWIDSLRALPDPNGSTQAMPIQPFDQCGLPGMSLAQVANPAQGVIAFLGPGARGDLA